MIDPNAIRAGEAFLEATKDDHDLAAVKARLHVEFARLGNFIQARLKEDEDYLEKRGVLAAFRAEGMDEEDFLSRCKNLARFIGLDPGPMTYAEIMGAIRAYLARRAFMQESNIQDEGDVQARAMMYRVAHPDATNEEVANAVNCHPKYLSSRECNLYKAMVKAQKEQARAAMPRGSKTKDENGKTAMEAWEDQS